MEEDWKDISEYILSYLWFAFSHLLIMENFELYNFSTCLFGFPIQLLLQQTIMWYNMMQYRINVKITKFCFLSKNKRKEDKKPSNLTDQGRNRCIEQSFRLCGRGRGWDDLGEWHWNMYNIIHEMNCQSRFDAWNWMLGAGVQRRPRGMVRGGRSEGGSGWGTRVHPWWIHVVVFQNQYNFVK